MTSKLQITAMPWVNKAEFYRLVLTDPLVILYTLGTYLFSGAVMWLLQHTTWLIDISGIPAHQKLFEAQQAMSVGGASAVQQELVSGYYTALEQVGTYQAWALDVPLVLALSFSMLGLPLALFSRLRAITAHEDPVVESKRRYAVRNVMFILIGAWMVWGELPLPLSHSLHSAYPLPLLQSSIWALIWSIFIARGRLMGRTGTFRAAFG